MFPSHFLRCGFDSLVNYSQMMKDLNLHNSYSEITEFPPKTSREEVAWLPKKWNKRGSCRAEMPLISNLFVAAEAYGREVEKVTGFIFQLYVFLCLSHSF